MATQRWLTDDEQRAWRAYQAMSTMLGAALDRQLQRDAGMPHGYYALLVMLSGSPDSASRMTDLANRTFSSQSRTSHAIAALEKRGWVRRERCTDDTRGTIAILTTAGKRVLEQSAPAHVEQVRALLFEQLTARQVRQLTNICTTVLTRMTAEPPA